MNTEICPHCGTNTFAPKTVDYPVNLPNGVKLMVPNTTILVCSKCGETGMTLESAERIDSWIAESNEQLTPSQLKRLRQVLGVDQDEMSQALGLGEKTFHRWERGNQIPSRSMGYYLRVLAEFPEAFDWLKKRGWRNPKNVIEVDFKAAFPCIDHETASTEKRINHAKVLVGRAL